MLLCPLLIFVFFSGPALASPYRFFNYTWLIINGVGDIANATSQVAASTPWPTLYVDLCALALGAPGWGTPDHFMPRSGPVNKELDQRAPRSGRKAVSCGSPTSRAILQNQAIYVCPGTHRNRSLASKCGYAPAYFCAAWDCETTGDGYWNPSSTWDFITVKRLSQITWNCKRWCNPLVISFTPAGMKHSWAHPVTWGLRLYISGSDPGLLFSIKLLQEPPQFKPIAIGPNPLFTILMKILLPFFWEKKKKHKKLLSLLRLILFTPNPDMLFQPTIPSGPVSSSQLILDMVNAFWRPPSLILLMNSAGFAIHLNHHSMKALLSSVSPFLSMRSPTSPAILTPPRE